MKLSQLRYFVTVAERGSVHGAARQLGVSQPAITRGLRDLEHELGAPLFERVGVGMVLTEVGKVVLRRAAGVQSDVARIRDEVDQMTGRSSGVVTIGLSFVAHAGLLPRVVEAFRRQAPNVRLEVRESLFGQIEPEIYNGVVDFYVGPMQPGDNFQGKLAIEPLFENRRQVFCRSDHPLAQAQSLADLTQASWVTGSVTPDRGDELAPLFRFHGLPPPHVAMNAQTFLSMMLIAASSDLLAMMPQQLHQLLSMKSMLVRVPVAEKLPSSTICIVRRAAIPLTPVAEGLSDLFRRAAINHAVSLPDSTPLTR